MDEVLFILMFVAFLFVFMACVGGFDDLIKRHIEIEKSRKKWKRKGDD